MGEIKNYKKSNKNVYENSPYLRLLYGKQLLQLHESVTNKGIDITDLISSVILNKIKEKKN